MTDVYSNAKREVPLLAAKLSIQFASTPPLSISIQHPVKKPAVHPKNPLYPGLFPAVEVCGWTFTIRKDCSPHDDQKPAL
jgi:hypothetical protein